MVLYKTVKLHGLISLLLTQQVVKRQERTEQEGLQLELQHGREECASLLNLVVLVAVAEEWAQDVMIMMEIYQHAEQIQDASGLQSRSIAL